MAYRKKANQRLANGTRGAARNLAMWRVDVVGVALALGSCERGSKAESQSSQRSKLLGSQSGPFVVYAAAEAVAA